MKICGRCGTCQPDEDRFCIKCGARFDGGVSGNGTNPEGKKPHKKWILPVAISCGAVALVLSVGFIVFSLVQVNSESFTILLNWKINLRGESSDIYYKDTGPSVQGDGPRLSVMKYKSFQVVSKAVKWKDGPDIDLENAMNSFFATELPVEQKYMPDFTAPYKYYEYQETIDGPVSETDPGAEIGVVTYLYLVYDLKTNTLYAAEYH